MLIKKYLIIGWFVLVFGAVASFSKGENSASDIDLPEDADTSDWTESQKLQISANRIYYKDKSKIQSEYRRRLSGVVSLSTRIDIFLLDSKYIANADDADMKSVFYIRPYGKHVKITNRIKTPPEELINVRKAVVELL